MSNTSNVNGASHLSMSLKRDMDIFDDLPLFIRNRLNYAPNNMACLDCKGYQSVKEFDELYWGFFEKHYHNWCPLACEPIRKPGT